MAKCKALTGSAIKGLKKRTAMNKWKDYQQSGGKLKYRNSPKTEKM